MPRPLIPHKSACHRAASFAIYRSLLRRTKQLPVRFDQQSQIRQLVNSIFYRYRYLQKHSAVAERLQHAYQANQLFLASANGDLNSTNRILDGLEVLLPLYPKPRPKRHKKPKALRTEETATKREEIKDSADSDHTADTRPEHLRKPIFNRPYPVVSGKRHIPKLVNANGIPILRIKKPQPIALTRMINHKVDRRIRHYELYHVLEGLREDSKLEDTWDWRMEQLGAAPDLDGTEPFQQSIHVASQYLHDIYVAEGTKRIEVAREYSRIVEEETALAVKEREQKRREAMQKRWEKWLERKQAVESGQLDPKTIQRPPISGPSAKKKRNLKRFQLGSLFHRKQGFN